MRCRHAQKDISEYIDGALSAEREASLRRHLEGCAKCRAVLQDLQAIAGEAKELEKLLPPDRVWLKIRTELREKRAAAAGRSVRFAAPRPAFSFASPRFRLAFASSLTLLVIAAGLFYFQPWHKPMPVEKAALERRTLDKLNEAEWHYQQAIKALSEAAAAQKGGLDPQLAQVFRANLEIVDASIQTCRQAVLRDPRDLRAQNALLLSYKDKVDILREMLEVSSSSAPAKSAGMAL
jgi:anti-sigma factor RsiW